MHTLTTAALYFVELLHQLLLVFKRRVLEDELCLYRILLWVRSQRLLCVQIPGGKGYDYLETEVEQLIKYNISEMSEELCGIFPLFVIHP